MDNQFSPIGHDYVSRNFNDRRPGNMYDKYHEPRGGNWRPDAGGSSVTPKPKKPKPMSPLNTEKVY
jgi:hypothetical protein